jgi:hypothetical protein
MALYKKLIFYGEQLLATRPALSWRTILCQLSLTGYSANLQIQEVTLELNSKLVNFFLQITQ